MMKHNKSMTYAAPDLEVLQMEVERGIASSEAWLITPGEAFDEIYYEDEL